MAPPVFPTLPGLGWPVTRTPIWHTLVQEAISGRETRIGLWSWPKYQYELNVDFLRQNVSFPEYQNLIGFINQVGGCAHPFYFLDVNDNTATAQPFATSDGSTTAYQLGRSMGGYIEPVQSPRTDTALTVFVNGSPTSNYTIGYAGQINFNSAPTNGATLTWTGSYYWLCRFNTDNGISIKQFMSGLHSVDKIVFTTIKL